MLTTPWGEFEESVFAGQNLFLGLEIHLPRQSYRDLRICIILTQKNDWMIDQPTGALAFRCFSLPVDQWRNYWEKLCVKVKISLTKYIKVIIMEISKNVQFSIENQKTHPLWDICPSRVTGNFQKISRNSQILFQEYSKLKGEKNHFCDSFHKKTI